MKTIAQATGALFAVAMAVAPAWAELTLTDVGLPNDSGWTRTAWTAGNKELTADTAFTNVSGGASEIRATGYNISLAGAATGTQIAWNGTIAADTIYLKQGRFSPDNSASLGFLGSAKVYVKGQFFADAWASRATTTGISLSNEFYLAPSTYTENNFNNVSIRVHDGNLALTGKVTLLPESTSSKGTVKVKTGNEASSNRTLTLSQLDLTQVAVGGNTTECLTVEGELTVVFANGATLNLPAAVVDQGWVKVLTAGRANTASFEALTVQLDGNTVDSQQYTVVKNAATGSVKVVPAREPVSFERTLSTANEHWTAGAEEALWRSAGVNRAGVNPSEIDSVTLAVETSSELTLSEETTVASLTLNGPSALTFKPTTSGETTTGSLMVLSSTAVNTDTDVSDITATLGTVTLDSGKTLTMNGLAFSAMTNNGGALCFKGGTVNSTLLQTFDGKMTLRDGADVTLPEQYAMNSAQRFIADSGSATLTLYNTNESDGVIDTDEDETIQVKEGAQLTLKARDLGGWNGYRGDELVVAVRGTGSKIWADTYDNTNPGCFVGRVVLADGGEIAGGSTASAALDFYGTPSTNSTKANYPEIYVSSGTGTWSGYLWRNKGLVVKVAEGATFVLSGTLKSNDVNNKALTKVGAGEMQITAAQTENSGAYAINEGKLTFDTETDLTLSNTISGTGTLGKSGAGTLTLTGTLSNFTGRLEVTAGTLVIPAGKESADSTIGAGARLALVLSSEQLAAGYSSRLVSESIVFKKEVDGSLVDVTAEDGTTENGTFTPKLNTWEGDTATDGVYAWSNGENWSKGSAPAAGDHVVVALGEGIGTPTLTADTTVVALSITGSGALNLAGFTLTANKIKGESQETTALTLEGTGTVKLNASTKLERKTLEALTLTVPSGVILATELTGNDGNPIFADVAITFANGASWKSYGWLELADTVTVTNAGDLELAILNGAQPSLWGSGTLQKRGAGTLTINGMGGTHENPLVIEAGTLNLTSNGTATFTGGISGEGALKIGSGTVVLSTTANTYTGGTEIAENATLKLTATSAQTLSGNISGSGSLEIGNGSAAATVALTGLNEGYSGTITVAERSTLSNGSSSASVPFGKGRIVNNGVLNLTGPAAEASTDYAQLPPTSGSGNITFCAGSTSRIPGEITTTGTVTFEGTTEETAAAVVTFIKNATDFSGKVASISGASVVVGEGVTLAKDGASTPLITIVAGRSLSGSGTINVPVVFENAATATMASDANLTFTSALTVPKNVTLPGTITLGEGAVLSGAGTLSGTVTLNSGVIIDATKSTASGYLKLMGSSVTLGETLKVKASKLTNVLDVQTSVGLDLAKVSLTDDSTIPTGAKLMTSVFETVNTSITTLKFFVPPTVPKAPTESPRDTGVDTQIAQAAETYAGGGMIISEVTTITGTGSNGTGTREINGSSLFENVLTLTPVSVKDDGTYTAKVTVAYDFGVADMTIKRLQLEGDDAAKLYVLLAAKVQNSVSSNTADFAEGTTLKVMNGENECASKSVTAVVATGVADAAETKGVQWLAVPLETLFPESNSLGTRSLKVKASKASN